MDNITHSIIGVLSAEGLGASSEKNPPATRRLILWISLIANNFPDLDFAYGFITPGRLGYLLHHRGHTHTILGVIGIAGLLTAVTTGLARIFRWSLPAKSLRTVFTTALVGGGLHLFLDSWNSYGIHPFWPWDNHWYSLDSVFILEPAIWILGGIYALQHPSRTVKTISLVFLSGTFVLLWISDLIPKIVFSYCLVFAVVEYLLLRIFPQRRLRIVGISIAGILAIFAVSSAIASRTLRNHVLRNNAAILSLSVSPLPANPFCFIGTVAAKKESKYTADLYTATPWPRIVGPKGCPQLDFSNSFFVTQVSDTKKQIDHLVRFERSYDEYLGLQQNCHAHAFLRFAETPIWENIGDKLAMSDLRFERGSRRSFSHLLFETSETCPPWVPPWEARLRGYESR